MRAGGRAAEEQVKEGESENDTAPTENRAFQRQARSKHAQRVEQNSAQDDRAL
jgi:hypothetical protein